MRINKFLFCITLFLSILSLSTSIILNSCKCECSVFWTNVILAIFGSSFLLMISSIAGYFVEKRKYEFRFASYARSFLLKIGRFINTYNSVSDKTDEIYRESGMLHSLYDDFAYENNVDIKGYFCKCGKSRKRMADLQKSIDDLAKKISTIEYEAQYALHNKKDYQLNTTITTSELDAIHNKIILLFNHNSKEEHTNDKP